MVERPRKVKVDKREGDGGRDGTNRRSEHHWTVSEPSEELGVSDLSNRVTLPADTSKSSVSFSATASVKVVCDMEVKQLQR